MYVNAVLCTEISASEFMRQTHANLPSLLAVQEMETEIARWAKVAEDKEQVRARYLLIICMSPYIYVRGCLKRVVVANAQS